MTDYQKFTALWGAFHINAEKVGLLDKMRSYISGRNWLASFMRLAKEREWIIAELNKLPPHICA